MTNSNKQDLLLYRSFLTGENKYMPEKIIFLDVDGVLNCRDYINDATNDIDPSKVQMIADLCNKTNAKVVITSSWRGKNGEMIERDTIEYLFSKLESNISNGTFSAIFCKDDDKPVISKNDVKKAIKDTLEEANYIA